MTRLSKNHVMVNRGNAAVEIRRLKKELEDKQWVIEKTDAGLKTLYRELNKTKEELENTNVILGKKVQERTIELEKLTEDLKRDITKRKKLEKDLKERLKELKCLYLMTHDMQKKLSAGKLCKRIIKYLLQAMQYPETTTCLIDLDDRRFASEGYTEGLSPGIQADIKSKDKVYGCISVYNTEGKPFLIPEEQNFIYNIAENLAMWLERNQTDKELQQSYIKLQKALEQTIHVLASTVEKRDPYTAGHQRRVAELARAIAREMKFSERKIEALYMAGLIHDIGKISVPSEILSKPTELSEIEMDIIKCHAQVSYDIIKEIEFPWPIAQIVLQHHERMDGSGYPNGLQGEDIISEARILAVADVVESMASPRPYRPSLGIEEALKEISQNRGVLYDPEVVDACLRLFKEKGFHIS